MSGQATSKGAVSPGATPVQLECNICGQPVKEFKPYGPKKRPNVKCPHCGAIDRNRAFWCFAKNFTNLFDGQAKKLLHVAPEVLLTERLKAIPGIDYLSSDLSRPTAMVKMDLTDIQYPDNQWDIIICSHVLEHIPDDRKAMREMCRVLKPGGWFSVQVPVRETPTYEDWSITEPEERVKAFGQFDHVRVYGPDLADRLCECGFDAKMVQAGKVLPIAEVRRYGIKPKAILFHCVKPLNS